MASFSDSETNLGFVVNCDGGFTCARGGVYSWSRTHTEMASLAESTWCGATGAVDGLGAITSWTEVVFFGYSSGKKPFGNWFVTIGDGVGSKKHDVKGSGTTIGDYGIVKRLGSVALEPADYVSA